MTKDKERDDALIAEMNRLAADLERMCNGEWLAGADAKFRRIATLLRGDEQSKPDRYVVAWKEADEAYMGRHPTKHESVMAAAAVLRKHFPEAERPDGTDWFKGEVDCNGNELVTLPKDELDKYKDQVRYTCQRAEKAEARVKELEAERPAVVVPEDDWNWACENEACEGTTPNDRLQAASFIISQLDGAKGDE